MAMAAQSRAVAQVRASSSAVVSAPSASSQRLGGGAEASPDAAVDVAVAAGVVGLALATGGLEATGLGSAVRGSGPWHAKRTRTTNTPTTTEPRRMAAS
jgi:hypothetical protein